MSPFEDITETIFVAKTVWFSSGIDETAREGKLTTSVGMGVGVTSGTDVMNGAGDFIGETLNAAASVRNIGEEIIVSLSLFQSDDDVPLSPCHCFNLLMMFH